MSTIADALVLTFTETLSLAAWEDLGILDREWALYERLQSDFGCVVLVTYGDSRDEQIAQRLGVDVVLAPTEGSMADRKAVAAFEVAQLLQSAASVVVKTNQMHGGELGVQVARSLRAKNKQTTLVARGGYLCSKFASKTDGPDSILARTLAQTERELCGSADIVVGTTTEMVEDLAWRYQLPSARTRVVPNYVVPEANAANERTLNEILYVGRLVPLKRVDLLIESVASIDGARLTIIGDGPDRKRLASLASDRYVNAEFRGQQSHAEVRDAMSRCTVYAQLSAKEGHPKTVIEAMSSGAPVVIADAPGLRTVVESGTTGIVVPADAGIAGQAIRSLLDNTGERERLGRNASAWANQRFGIDTVIEIERAMLREAVAEQRGSDHERAAA